MCWTGDAVMEERQEDSYDRRVDSSASLDPLGSVDELAKAEGWCALNEVFPPVVSTWGDDRQSPSALDSPNMSCSSRQDGRVVSRNLQTGVDVQNESEVREGRGVSKPG